MLFRSAREELNQDDKENILGVNSPLPESFRPPHPSDAKQMDLEKAISTAQLDWDDHVAPV